MLGALAGSPSKAIDAAHRELPSDAGFVLLRSSLEAVVGKPGSASWDRLLAFGSFLRTDERKLAARYLHTLALGWSTQGVFDRVDDSRSLSIALAPADPRLRHVMAVDAVAAGQRSKTQSKDESLGWFAYAATLAPNPTNLTQLAVALIHSGRPSDARLAFEQALVLGADDVGEQKRERSSEVDDLVRIGIEAQHATVDLAQLVFLRAIQMDPGSVSARNSLDWLHFRRGEYSAAGEQFRLALALLANSTSQFNLALTTMAQGEMQEGEDLYRKGVGAYGWEEFQRVGGLTEPVELASQTSDPEICSSGQKPPGACRCEVKERAYCSCCPPVSA
jgi:tetratricopeptide (TPR) repeat protein